jgi:hypothetical protein
MPRRTDKRRNRSGLGGNFLRHSSAKFIFGDLLMKEVGHECLCCLVPSLLRPAIGLFCGCTVQYRLPLLQQYGQQRRRSGVFEARLILEPVCAGAEEGAVAQ